jgi:hypothetical protein
MVRGTALTTGGRRAAGGVRGGRVRPKEEEVDVGDGGIGEAGGGETRARGKKTVMTV